jgi:hypothetical protein
VNVADDVRVKTLVEIARQMVWILSEDGERVVARPGGYDSGVGNEDVETAGSDCRCRCSCFLEGLY